MNRMNKTAEVVLTALALAGMYWTIPRRFAPVGNPVIHAEQAVVIADGSDPMPLCRGKVCSQ